MREDEEKIVAQAFADQKKVRLGLKMMSMSSATASTI